MPLTLRTAIDRTPHTEALFDGRVRSGRVRLEFVAVKPIPRAFRRMVRDEEFDASEMALATLAIAHAYGKPLRMLPAPLVREQPFSRLVCLRGAPFSSPADLAGRRIAVRAYSQTTAVWVRGILQHEYGVDPGGIVWLTQEDSHVAELPPHANERRLGGDVELGKLLEEGRADAAVTLHLGHHEAIRTVLADPEAAGAAWQARLGLKPINHLLAVRSGLLEAHPWLGAELVELFEAARRAGTPDGSDPLPWEPAGAALLLRFVHEQGLTAASYTLGELFAELPSPAEPRRSHTWPTSPA